MLLLQQRKFMFRRRSGALRGFSLTELMIVLGVAAIIIGGVWTLASQAWNTARREQSREWMTTLVNNTRAYGQQTAGVSGLLTPTLIANGAIPNYMVRPGSTTLADNPWGPTSVTTQNNGSLLVCAWLLGSTTVCGAAPGAKQPYFAIEFQGITVDNCIYLAMRNSGSDAPSGLADVSINGTSIINTAGQLPVDLTTAQADCQTTANSVKGIRLDFVFRLVPPAN